MPTTRWNDHYGDVLDTSGDYQIIACTECQFTHATPLPTAAFLQQFYAEEFFQHARPDYIQRYEEDRAWWEAHHSYTLSQIAAFLRKNGKELHVLDVGSGPGIFLDTAKKMRWHTSGVEPCAALCEILAARGHAMVCGMLEDIQLSARSPKFDCVHLYEVLEHVPNPVEFLGHCRELMNPHAMLCVVVPNDYNPLQMQAVDYLHLSHYWVAPPQHLNYFSPVSLRSMLARCGFLTLDMRGTHPMEHFLLSGHNYIGNDALGRQCHHARVQYELEASKNGAWSALMQTYRNNLNQEGKGREIVVLARKVEE